MEILWNVCELIVWLVALVWIVWIVKHWDE